MYIKNKNDYNGGYFQGENTIYVGNGKISGLGMSKKSEKELREELRAAYVNDTGNALKKEDAKTEIGFTNHSRLKLK